MTSIQAGLLPGERCSPSCSIRKTPNAESGALAMCQTPVFVVQEVRYLANITLNRTILRKPVIRCEAVAITTHARLGTSTDQIPLGNGLNPRVPRSKMVLMDRQDLIE
jgi:hypothetical protein